MGQTRRKRLSGRAFTTFLVTFFFLAMAFSGAVLYATPKGRVAHWTGWRFWGLDKEQWSAVHTTTSVLFVIVAVVHLVNNRRVFSHYVMSKTRAGLNRWAELLAAGLICAAVMGGTIWEVPPFGQFLAANDRIKRHWAQAGPRGPYAHAEESTLAEFAEWIGLTAAQAAEALRKEGFEVRATDQTVGQLAAAAGVAPSEVYAAILKHHPEAGAGPGRGGGGGQGAGRRRGG